MVSNGKHANNNHYNDTSIANRDHSIVFNEVHTYSRHDDDDALDAFLAMLS